MNTTRIKSAALTGLFVVGLGVSTLPTTAKAAAKKGKQTKKNGLLFKNMKNKWFAGAALTALGHIVCLYCKDSVENPKTKFSWKKLAEGNLKQVYHFWNDYILGQRMKDREVKAHKDGSITCTTKKTPPTGFFGKGLAYMFGLKKAVDNLEDIGKLPHRIRKLTAALADGDVLWGIKEPGFYKS